MLGGSGLALAALAWFILRDSPAPTGAISNDPPPSPVETLTALARIPSYWILLATGMLMAVGIWMFFNWLPLYFRETYRLSLAGAGFSGTFMLQAAATIGGLAGGVASDRFAAKNPNRRMLFEALCYAAAAPCLIAFAGRPHFAVLSVCIGLFAFFRALGGVSQLAVICDLLETRRRSTAIGLSNTANCFAGGIGVFIAGYLKEDFGIYGFVGVQGRAVGRNIFLDGNTFRDSPSVYKEPLVADLQTGVSVFWDWARLDAAVMYRTDEFEGQDKGDTIGIVSFGASW